MIQVWRLYCRKTVPLSTFAAPFPNPRGRRLSIRWIWDRLKNLLATRYVFKQHFAFPGRPLAFSVLLLTALKVVTPRLRERG